MANSLPEKNRSALKPSLQIISELLGRGGHRHQEGVVPGFPLLGFPHFRLSRETRDSTMGWEEVSVQGYAEFVRVAREQQRQHGQVFVYFSGDKDSASGDSWCPDCIKAEPIVRAELPNLPEGSVFIYCQVGPRDYWKNPNNEFKKNLKLTGVPTLLKYGTPQKLVEEDCFNSNLVRMLFTED